MSKLVDRRSQFEGFDMADFAQEFLRRNRDYRLQHARLGEMARRNPSARQCREMAHSWGLVFPVPARIERIAGACDLESH